MKTIFFNNPIGTEKVAFTVSNESVAQLKSAGIIPKTATTVSYDFIDENSDLDLQALITFPDRCVFDNIKKPTKVLLDMELINYFYLTEAKEARNRCLQILDELQIRALCSNKTDVVVLIEADKEKLRNLPDTIDFTNATNVEDSYNSIPASQLVPEHYKTKYEATLK